jgi:hypothetical protein
MERNEIEKLIQKSIPKANHYTIELKDSSKSNQKIPISSNNIE